MTSIEWTDVTWNCIRGCSRVSAGCENCYAEQVARRFAGSGQPYEGLVRLTKEGKPKAQWNGTVRFIPEHLGDPLSWRKPRRVFVNSMSDLFHEGLAFEDIAAIFGVMAACPQHTFQVLTKRPARAREFFDWISDAPVSTGGSANAARGVKWFAWNRIDSLRVHDPALPWVWPLPNVWLGVSVENQATADERIPVLLDLPAAVRWVSYEPALGPIEFDLARCDDCGEAADSHADDGTPWCSEHDRECSYGHWLDFPSDGSFDEPRGGGANGGISWVVVGGESGPGARPFDIAWARSTIEQCRDAGTSCFVKQLGASPIAAPTEGSRPKTQAGGDPWPAQPLRLRDRKGGDMSEWPEDLRVRSYPR